MNKYVYHIAYCLIAAMTLQACGSDNPNNGTTSENTVTVSIVTDIETRASVTTLFRDGDKMNVYAKTYGKPDAPDMVKDIQATFRNGSWSMTPEIKLAEGEKAFIYAIAPYMGEISNLTAIPVDIAHQQDILYSGSFVPVTHNTHQAKLTMKHALTLTTFNISSRNYPGKGELQSIGIAGETVYTKGKMSVESGKTTGTEKGSHTVAYNKTIMENGWNEALPRMWVIPFSTKAAEATVKVKIDGKEYETVFPEVEMKSGTQYIFRLILTNNGLEFIADQTIVISLDQDTDQMEELTGYGILRIAHTAREFAVPVLTGDNVFGFVNWGDNISEAYSVNASHTYGSTGEKVVSIESWNTTGFELGNLSEIETIDITQYQE